MSQSYPEYWLQYFISTIHGWKHLLSANSHKEILIDNLPVFGHKVFRKLVAGSWFGLVHAGRKIKKCGSQEKDQARHEPASCICFRPILKNPLFLTKSSYPYKGVIGDSAIPCSRLLRVFPITAPCLYMAFPNKLRSWYEEGTAEVRRRYGWGAKQE